MVALLLQIGVPRAGTTNFVRLLNSFPDVLAIGEIFHPKSMYFDGSSYTDTLVDELRRQPFVNRIADNGVADAVTARFARRHPDTIIDTLHDFCRTYDKRFLCFKLFPAHLSRIQTVRLIKKYKPFVIFSIRNPLDTFISLSKARSIGRWSGADTSQVLPALDVDEFLSWHHTNRQFLRLVYGAAQRYAAGTTEITYQEMYEGGAEPIIVIQRKLTALGVELGSAGPIQTLPRQDRNDHSSTKVKNWDAFVAEAARRGVMSSFGSFDYTGRANHLDFELQRLRSYADAAWRRLQPQR